MFLKEIQIRFLLSCYQKYWNEFWTPVIKRVVSLVISWVDLKNKNQGSSQFLKKHLSYYLLVKPENDKKKKPKIQTLSTSVKFEWLKIWCSRLENITEVSTYWSIELEEVHEREVMLFHPSNLFTTRVCYKTSKTCELVTLDKSLFQSPNLLIHQVTHKLQTHWLNHIRGKIHTCIIEKRRRTLRWKWLKLKIINFGQNAWFQPFSNRNGQ